MLDFEIHDSSGNIISYQFDIGVYLLGKGDQCDVLLNDGHVSRVHAELIVKKHSAQLTDRKSTNGTWFEARRYCHGCGIG